MLGCREFRLFETLKIRADELNFTVEPAKYGENCLTLIPKDEEYPIYTRGADCFYSGDANSLLSFLHGFAKAREYDEQIGLSNDEKREAKEQKVKDKLFLAKLKQLG